MLLKVKIKVMMMVSIVIEKHKSKNIPFTVKNMRDRISIYITWPEVSKGKMIKFTLQPTSRKCTILSNSNQVLPKREWPSANLNIYMPTCHMFFSLAEQQESPSHQQASNTPLITESNSVSPARAREKKITLWRVHTSFFNYSEVKSIIPSAFCKL